MCVRTMCIVHGPLTLKTLKTLLSLLLLVVQDWSFQREKNHRNWIAPPVMNSFHQIVATYYSQLLTFQTLAQNQLFLFFTGILQRFRLKAPNGPSSVSTEPIVGFIHSCPDYEVEFETRVVRKQTPEEKMPFGSPIHDCVGQNHVEELNDET